MLRGISRAFRSVHTKWQQFRRDESGSMVAVVAVIPVLVGAVAVGVETGQLYRVKRQMQNAADAAALAGSFDRLAAKSGTAITATAQYEAQRNGFTNGSNGVTVTVNAPPAPGSPNVNVPGAVEVIITKSQQFHLGAALSSWLGVTPTSFTTRARTVAAQGSFTTTTASAEGCVVALSTGNEYGIRIDSLNSWNIDCSLISNTTLTGQDSNASVFINNTNSGNTNGVFSAKSVYARGDFNQNNYNSVTLQIPAATRATTVIADPYADLANPTFGTCSYNPYSVPTTSTVSPPPGVYCGGLSISGKTTVSFAHGTYYIVDGDLSLRNNTTVNCSDCTGGAGVTFVLTRNTGTIGGVKLDTISTLNLVAPTSGTYAGVLFYQDRRATAGTWTSTAGIFSASAITNATLAGAIYFPNNLLTESGLTQVDTLANRCLVWIGRYVKFSSAAASGLASCTTTYGTKAASIMKTTTVTKARTFE